MCLVGKSNTCFLYQSNSTVCGHLPYSEPACCVWSLVFHMVPQACQKWPLSTYIARITSNHCLVVLPLAKKLSVFSYPQLFPNTWNINFEFYLPRTVICIYRSNTSNCSWSFAFIMNCSDLLYILINHWLKFWWKVYKSQSRHFVLMHRE